MKDFIVQIAVKAFLIVFGVVIVAFIIFNFACPQHMATFAESIGNYGLALRYASMRYSYTSDTRDLARCVEDAVFAEDNASVIEYGGMFFEKDDCAQVMYDLTLENNVNYLNFFGGALVSAHYAEGDFSAALDVASDLNGTESFAAGNPLIALASAVISSSDAANAPALVAVLQGVSPEDGEQSELLSEVLADLSAVSGGTAALPGLDYAKI